jgi:hypothetical protein
MLYFAYGSNLNARHMARRCPDAKPLGKFFLDDALLVFRGVADCILTADCENTLDRYEGVRSGFYSKEYLDIAGIPGEPQLMLYVMNSTGVMPPSLGYLETIKAGYRDFRLPLAPLRAAVQRSWDEKNKTKAERARYYRTGFPTLARADQIPLEGKAGKAGTGNHRQHKRG